MVMQRRCLYTVPATTLAMFLGFSEAAMAGDLNPPPGPIVPTMKTLVEVEPRTPVQSLSGSATALHVISEPGSYYLTGNIAGESGKNGIEVAADDVTLDLNGYALLGMPESLDGVMIHAHRSNIACLSGSVRGWGDDGIDAGSDGIGGGRFIDVHAYGNGGRGLMGGSVWTITRCTATANGSHGIQVGTVATVTECSVAGNGGDGITLAVRSEGGLVTNCTSKENTGFGFRADTGVSIVGCVSTHDQGGGIEVEARCLVRQNLCWRGGSPRINVTGVGNRIEDNRVTIDGGTGIDVSGTSNLVVRNYVEGTGTKYSIGGGNLAGAITGDPVSAGPWANFSN